MLVIDIETAPSLGWVWAKWETNVIDFEQQWYILCFSALWEGGKVQSFALPDFPGYKKNKEDDHRLVQKAWELLDQADVVVGHNIKKFDIKKLNSRFIYHGMTPPSPYKTFDTLEAARRVMANNSNKLDDIGRDYGLGRKLPHAGFPLWQGCMRGDLKSWALMTKYCAQDVLLCYRWYRRIRPWAAHPNLNLVHGRPKGCPTCYGTHIQSRGGRFHYTSGQFVKLYVCADCGVTIKGESEKLTTKVVHRP